jgi:hypothetical protein
MMFLSFFLGRKYYPIHYDLMNILLYFVVALSIYFVNLYLRKVFDYYIVINIFMILGFFFFVYKKEKIILPKVFR